MSSHFINLISNAPNNFGVYNFIDNDGNIIYIGKARNIKKRLLGHAKSNAYKTHIAIQKTIKVTWIICKNEAEALLMENEQIKKFKPKYNIQLKDDKTFPEIFIDTTHDFPAIKYHRGKHVLNGKYFGPFANPNHVKSVIDIIKKTVMIRGCADGDFATRKRPCIEYQIKRCTAPCVGYVNKQEYLEQIKDAEMILEGKYDELKYSYTQQIQQFSGTMDFEKASILKQKIIALTYISNAVKSSKQTKDPLVKYLQEMYTKNKKDILDIKGLGDKRKKDLLLHFGSIDAIKNASLSEILNVKGIGLAIATLIYGNKS